MADINFSDASFKQDVLDAKGLVVVDFWAPWCGPCQSVGPVIEELAGEYAGKVKIGKVNVDENTQSPEQYGVMSLPTIMFFKDGKPVKTMIGVQSKETYKQQIDQFLG